MCARRRSIPKPPFPSRNRQPDVLSALRYKALFPRRGGYQPPAGYRIPPGVLLPSRRGAHCAPADEAPSSHHSQAETGSRMSRRLSGTTLYFLRRGGYQPPAEYRICPAYCSPPVGAHSVRPQTKHPKATIPKQKPAAGCPAGPPVQRPVPSVGAAISRPPGVCSRPAYCSPSAEAHTVHPCARP